MATTAGTISAVAANDTLVRPSRSLWSNALFKLRHDRLTIAAMIVLVLLAVLSAGADLFAQNLFKYSFEKQDLLHTYEKPTFDQLAYLLGTDEIGRSQVVRLLYGGRVSLAVGFVAALVNLSIGVVLGLSAGYFRGVVDDLYTWFVTTLQSIPTLFLLLIIAAIWEPGPVTLTIVIGALFWTGISLYCRGQTFSLRERTVMFVHALRNALIPVVTALGGILAGLIGGALVIETVFSWPGVGRFTFAAAIAKDYPVVQAGVMIAAVLLVISYILRDIAYAVVDPRIVVK